MNEIVLLEWAGDSVAVVTMSNPSINNHMSWRTVDLLAEALVGAREQGAKVSILASGVPGHWFEHAWLVDLMAVSEGKSPVSDAASTGSGWFQCLEELRNRNVVSIAAISGDCSGGGAELGWACDLRIAEKQARFAQPEVRLGLTTGIGGTSRLARLVGRATAAEMVLDGRPMAAERLCQLGGINHVVETGEALNAAITLGTSIARNSRAALAGLKQILADNDDLNASDALKREQDVFQTVVRTPEAAVNMRSAQSRYDNGETPSEFASD